MKATEYLLGGLSALFVPFILVLLALALSIKEYWYVWVFILCIPLGLWLSTYIDVFEFSNNFKR